MNQLEIYCVTNKRLDILENFNYNLGWVGKDAAPKNYIKCDNKENIFFKEQYYSELTFHYWYWKNLLNLGDTGWIGFSQKRRHWLKKNLKKEPLNKGNIKDFLLREPSNDWEGYDAIVCDPIYVNKVKKIKMIKRGFRSIIKKPEIFFNEKKQSLAFHFDMHHGYGNLYKAIELINDEDREDFLNFVNNSVSYNPHIMFIAKPKILNQWFETLFPWIFRCENFFGFSELKGYDTKRLYAYLAERYLSLWFNKHVKSLKWPWAFFDASEQ